MKTAIATIIIAMLSRSPCIAQDAAQMMSDNAAAIASLQSLVESADTKVNELAEKLRVARVSGEASLQEVEEMTGRLSHAVREAFNLQAILQLTQLDDAEAKIAIGRQRVAARQKAALEIVAKRMESLLNVPARAASPQAVLDAMERFSEAKDYEGFVNLLTDEEAKRFAGMLFQSMSMMRSVLALMESSTDPAEDSQQIRAIIDSSARFIRPDPSPEATAALQRLTNILPQFFYQIGASNSDGTPLERPNLSPEEFSKLLRQASGVLTDVRAFSAAMLKSASAMDSDAATKVRINSNWKIDVNGIRATATQLAEPIDNTICENAKIELQVENGQWKISKLTSDEEMMKFASGPAVSSAAPASPAMSGPSPAPAAPPYIVPPSNAPRYVPGGTPTPAAASPLAPQSAVSREDIRQLVQGRWIVESLTEGSDNVLSELPEPMEMMIEGDIMRLIVGTEECNGPTLLDWVAPYAWSNEPQHVDLINDPNGESETHQGILECDGKILRICEASSSSSSDKDFRPKLFVPGSKVNLYQCRKKVAAEAVSSMDAKEGKRVIPMPDEKLAGWDGFLALLPEAGTVLVMFTDGSENSIRMLPVAKSVAESASVQFIELPQTDWARIVAPPAIHFVLMKDRQLVATRSGLLTESRMQEFVALAKDWLTPTSTGVAENSLVRIDCYINPGKDNIGSQYGTAWPLTMAVVAVHEDQALLLGSDSIADYIEKGYACVAVVRDASGKQMQVPLDVIQTGPVKLLAKKGDARKSAATASVTLGDGQTSEISLPGLNSIYPREMTEPLDAYDTGSAIYQIRGAHGLTAVKLASSDYLPMADQCVLSGCFTRERQLPPIHNFRSPLHWQSQLVKKADGGIYGGNINGPELFDVLCPTHPASCGFTFNEDGCLIGMYASGSPSDKDMTHSVFQPYTTHSVLQAVLDKIKDEGLKARLVGTLENPRSDETP